jgi:uncharacterized membrane protein
MTALRWLNFAFAVVAVLPTAAHVLEMPNKLALEGSLWLGIQQHLYRGWGPFVGGPAEIGALLTTLLLLALRWRDRGVRNTTLIAALAYVGMLAAFFVFNRPVNEAVSHWTPLTLPANWASYRRQWETGHALAALFAAIGLVALARGWLIEHDRAAAQPRGR